MFLGTFHKVELASTAGFPRTCLEKNESSFSKSSLSTFKHLLRNRSQGQPKPEGDEELAPKFSTYRTDYRPLSPRSRYVRRTLFTFLGSHSIPHSYFLIIPLAFVLRLRLSILQRKEELGIGNVM